MPAISDGLKRLFAAEVGNEDVNGTSRNGASSPGGVNPATLQSAKDSLSQAPNNVAANWLGLEEKYGVYEELEEDEERAADKGIEEFTKELDALIDSEGGDTALSSLLEAQPA